MNRYFAMAFIAVCGFCVLLIMDGKIWALPPFLLGAVGIVYHARFNKKDADGK